MKKLLCLILAVMFTFGLISCSDNEDIPEIPSDLVIGPNGEIIFPPVDYIPE